MRTALFIIPLVFASGCASMSKEECLHADWRAIGYEDGAHGAAVSAISPRRRACTKKVGVAPDMSAYLAGRREGLERYCEPTNGFAVGSRGAAYNGVCEGPDAVHFLAAYQKGHQLYQLEAAHIGAGQAISDAQKDLWAVKRQIADVEVALVSPSTPHGARLELLAELKNLSEDKGRIETAIIALSRDEERAADDLAEYRAFLVAEGVSEIGALSPALASY